jgi:hypothetical protein
MLPPNIWKSHLWETNVTFAQRQAHLEQAGRLFEAVRFYFIQGIIYIQ